MIWLQIIISRLLIILTFAAVAGPGPPNPGCVPAFKPSSDPDIMLDCPGSICWEGAMLPGGSG